MMSSQKTGGLRRRWLANALGVVCALGLVCVLAVTATYAAHYYSHMRMELFDRAKATTTHFEDFIDQDYDAYCTSCIKYVQSFSDAADLELQLINVQGEVLASSSGTPVALYPSTSDIANAISTRGIQPFVGRDPADGKRILAVSSPLIYANDEIIGVLRFVSPTHSIDMQILYVALTGFFVLIAVVGVILMLSKYFVRCAMLPITQITEKAKRIANGTYGIQIQTHYPDEIGELAETINDLSTKISQNEKMQAEFISQLSHELRTPLTVINGWTETLLADDTMDADTRQGMKIISSEAKRLTEMVMDLLDFTRMQDGRMTLTVELSDLRSEFEDTVYMYSSRLAQEGIHLTYLDSDQDIPEIRCDPKRLRQVFLNILDNAAKHGGAGKRIEASIRYEKDAVIIRIRDFGPGIPDDELPLVKKKFYKGSSSVRGTGIGLAVSDEIVEMHGGTLTLENAKGGGTLVTVWLPASE